MRHVLNVKLVNAKRAIAAGAMVAASLFAAASGWASSRFRIEARSGGGEVPGAIACFFRPAGNVDLVDRLLPGASRCLPVDKVLSLPAGTWRFYVSAPVVQLMSAHPFEIKLAEPSNDAEPVRTIISDLAPSATINFESARAVLLPGQSFAVYVSNSRQPQSPPAILPVSSTTWKLDVPADTAVTPLVIDGATIAKVGDEILASAGSTASAYFLECNCTTLVVPFESASLKPDLPDVEMVPRSHAADRTRFSLAPNGMRGLWFIRKARPGTYDIQMLSSSWRMVYPVTVDVPFAPSARVLTSPPLIVERMNANVHVHWAIDTVIHDPAYQACDGKGNSVGPPTLDVMSCPGDGRPTAQRCATLRRITLPESGSGVASFAAPRQDSVWFVLRKGALVAAERSVIRSRDTEAEVRLRPAVVRGRVTRGGRSVRAQIDCGGDVTFSDEGTGQFNCFRNAREGLETLVAQPCGETDEYRQEFSASTTDQIVDIDIPANVLDVAVADLAGAALADAYVTVRRGAKDPAHLNPEHTAQTAEDGVARFPALQPHVQFEVCAAKDHYGRECTIVELERDGRRAVSLRLAVQHGRRGRVVNISAPALLYASVAGHVLDRAPVSSSGDFEFETQLGPDVTYFIVAAELPLVSPRSVSDREDFLTLELPSPHVREFEVRSAATRGPVTLMLGATLVPVDVFLAHQSLIRQQYVVDPTRPIHVRAVDATNGVTVLLASDTPDAFERKSPSVRAIVLGPSEIVSFP